MKSGLAIAEIYQRYGHSVFRRARQVLGNEDEARDVVHEIFLGLMERPGQFRGESAWSTWFYSATTHLCLNRLRNGRTRARLLEQHLIPSLTQAATPTPRAEVLVLTAELLLRLPEALADVAVYVGMDGMTHQEIADVLGCSRRHVGDLVERLREWMTKEERTQCRAV